MKLILASDRTFLLRYGYACTGIPKDAMEIGYVTTAAKVARTPLFFEETKNMMRANGYAFEEVDIAGKTREWVRDFFRKKNVMQIEGGNTFYLLKVVKETGFDETLRVWCGEGKPYIGTSAGAYIMCPTIAVADWSVDGKDRYGVRDFTALNYVPFVLKAHYSDAMEPLVQRKKKTLSYPLRVLRDGQGLLVEDGRCTFIGGHETKV